MKIDNQYSVFEGSRRSFVLTYETPPLPHAHHHRWRVGNKNDGGKDISLFLMVICLALMAKYAWPPPVSATENHWHLAVACDDVLSSSDNSHIRPPSIGNSDCCRAEIPEFIPRKKANAENSSIFSLPFYLDHFGYKIYWLYNIEMVFGRSLTTRRKYRFILLEWGWYFEKRLLKY